MADLSVSFSNSEEENLDDLFSPQNNVVDGPEELSVAVAL